MQIPDEILARIPTHLQRLYRTGEVVISKMGEFRYTAKSGHQTGGIAGWLQPTGNILSNAANLLPQLNFAMTAANTLVTAVGFAVVITKLNRIEQHILRIDQQCANIDQSLRNLAGMLLAVRGAISDLDSKLESFRTGLIGELRIFKLAEVFSSIASLSESLTHGRIDEALHLVPSCREKCYQALAIAGQLPVEASQFRFDMFRLAMVGRALVCRVHLVANDPKAALSAHTQTLQLATKFGSSFFGPFGEFLGTTPSAYLLPNIIAVSAGSHGRVLPLEEKESHLDLAMTPVYPFLPDGDRIGRIKSLHTTTSAEMSTPGKTIRLMMDLSMPISLEAEVRGVYDQKETPVSLERNGWASVALAYEIVAVQRGLEREVMILQTNPEAFRVLSMRHGDSSEPFAFISTKQDGNEA
jgi:flagellar biosynthesis regulator FlbT